MNADNRDELQQLVGADYRLQWIIGHGGMSTVWLADDRVNDREVAIKVLRPEFSSNEEFLTRFRNEALAAEGINSPNVVATYDYREVQTSAGYSMCFIVMEYIRGESLADLIAREGKLDEALALDVLEQATHGLAVIHRMGLVHRDIKPGNLMITQNGQVKITDFGIAKAAAAVPLTRTGMVVGTAQYVSPEQAQGMRVTSASDVYSLGVVGYEMLSGARPFTGDSSVSVALAHVSAAPPAMSTSISAPARELVEIALRKDPQVRFHDGNEMQLAVAQVRKGLRPAQPRGGATTQVAVEPSATASTQMLASVAQPTTMQPADWRDGRTRAADPTAHVAQRQRPAVEPEDEKRGGFALGLGLAAVILAAGGALVWAFTAGPLGGNTQVTSTTPTIITETETVTPTERPAAPTTERTAEPSTPRESRPSSEPSSPRENPGTLTISDEPPTPVPEPDPQEPPTQPLPEDDTIAPPEAPAAPTPSNPAPGGADAPAETVANGPVAAPEIQLPPIPQIGGTP
ncbi:protein kinase domain-containing protein [Corynebacterium sp.]|uniref:protein kinase domain-containing protein n=1 Tax=Corynebacterium sp. TaxID=1720 RepID=UPI002A90B366|nr:protein kinase [Corynebacterium sp.]MDY5785606.1 protein kinase [Corynebacterium sp.]